MSRDHIAIQEDANMRACHAAAQAAGKTAEQADNCDDGEHKCPTCPWRRNISADDERSALRIDAEAFPKLRAFVQGYSMELWEAFERRNG